MMLIDNWKDVVKKAWSIRLMVLAGLFSGLEVILPLFVYDLPRNVFAGLSMLVILAAFVARLMAQQELRREPKE